MGHGGYATVESDADVIGNPSAALVLHVHVPEVGVRGSEKGVTGAGSQGGSLVERRTVANASGSCCGGR